MKIRFAVFAVVAMFAGAASGSSVYFDDGSLTVTGKPGSGTGGAQKLFYAAGGSLDARRDANNQVALRGWVDLSGVQGSVNGNIKYWFDIALVDTNSTQRRIQVGFSTNELGGWRGIPAQDWDKVSLSSQSTSVQNPGPEKWYTTEGGTTDDTTPPTYIEPSDRSYYFQMIFTHVGSNAPTYDLYVYAMGRGDNNNDKQWYNLGQMTHSGGTPGLGFPNFLNINRLQVYMGSTADAETTDVSTVNWYGLTLGAPIAMNAPPPAVPEPLTMVAVGMGIAGLGGYIRRRRMAAK